MESPLDILSRAAGIVSSQNGVVTAEGGDDVDESCVINLSRRNVNADDDNEPIDMSCKKKITEKPFPSVKRHRPSVIAFARNQSKSSSSEDESPPRKVKYVRKRFKNRTTGTASNSNFSNLSSSNNNSNVKAEDMIDEHFRRSLGPQVYNKLETKEEKRTVLLDEPLSVDDHFAKALGSETWNKIQNSNNP